MRLIVWFATFTGTLGLYYLSDRLVRHPRLRIGKWHSIIDVLLALTGGVSAAFYLGWFDGSTPGKAVGGVASMMFAGLWWHIFGKLRERADRIRSETNVK